MTGPTDIHAYLAAFEDIPGTRVFTAAQTPQGYPLDQFAMSPMKPENRERWKSDERTYLAHWKVTDDRTEAALERDYNRLLDLGGDIDSMAKLFSTDAQSFLQAVSTMGRMSLDDYSAMMIAGGGSPQGMRSLKDS